LRQAKRLSKDKHLDEMTLATKNGELNLVSKTRELACLIPLIDWSVLDFLT
jgi:hypothetical protein